jgi:hypothetical protein
LAVSLDHHAVHDGYDRECDAPRACLQYCSLRDFFDEPGQLNPLQMLNALRETNLAE